MEDGRTGLREEVLSKESKYPAVQEPGTGSDITANREEEGSDWLRVGVVAIGRMEEIDKALDNDGH